MFTEQLIYALILAVVAFLLGYILAREKVKKVRKELRRLEETHDIYKNSARKWKVDFAEKYNAKLKAFRKQFNELTQTHDQAIERANFDTQLAQELAEHRLSLTKEKADHDVALAEDKASINVDKAVGKAELADERCASEVTFAAEVTEKHDYLFDQSKRHGDHLADQFNTLAKSMGDQLKTLTVATGNVLTTTAENLKPAPATKAFIVKGLEDEDVLGPEDEVVELDDLDESYLEAAELPAVPVLKEIPKV